MKRTARRKVLTSGRLTAGARVQPVRRRVAANPAPSVGVEPAYSLYSTSSEEQVASLHVGLDRCAALLDGILQIENTECSPNTVQAVKEAVESLKSPSSRCKTSKKASARQEQRLSFRRGQTSQMSAAPHTGVKLHPPQKRTPLPSLLHRHTPTAATAPSQPSSILLSVLHTDRPSVSEALAKSSSGREEDEDEDEDVPVKDVQCGVPLLPATIQLFPDQTVEASNRGGGRKLKTFQYLLGELKTLIAGQGSIAEKLLTHLEQIVSMPLMNGSGSNTENTFEVQSLLTENTQLRRRVRTLNQQLKEREKADRKQRSDALDDSLQQELTAAQLQLQQLHIDLRDLRSVLQDTQSTLRTRDEENHVMRTDLQTVEDKLLQSEQDRSRLASVMKQQQEEIEQLNRRLSDSSGKRVTQYLLSLDLVPAERDTRERLPQTSSHPAADQLIDQSHHTPQVQQEAAERKQPMDVSQCDQESTQCDWSLTSSSTFDTRDEAAFRDGLAALDASIASLQKTIAMDKIRAEEAETQSWKELKRF